MDLAARKHWTLNWKASARNAAGWLVRLEIPLLSLIFTYFVVSDAVPLAAFALIALIWLARLWLTGALVPRTRLDLPILIILLWLPLSLSVSTNWWLSLPKVYGVVLGVCFYYASVHAVATPRDQNRAAFWLAVVSTAIALAGLVGTDWAQGKIVSLQPLYEHLPRFVQGIPRSIAGGFARNGVGGTLTLTIPLLACLWWAGERGSRGAEEQTTTRSQTPRFPAGDRPYGHWFSVVVVGGLALSLVTLALTQSRGAIIGTAVGLLGVAIWRERRFAWVVAAAVVGVAALFALGYGNAFLELILRMDGKSGTLASRMEVWQRGVMMVQDFPFTGIGIGTYNVIAHSLYPFFIAAPDEVVAHAHNNLLQIAVDLGIPGLIAFVGLLTAFGVTVARAHRASRDAGTRAMLAGVGFGMLAHQTFGLTDAFILGTKPGVLIWAYFALAVALGRLTKGEGHGTKDGAG